MRKIQLAVAAAVLMSAAAVPASAAQVVKKKHHKLATLAAGVGAYELAKHSHNNTLHKHRFMAGIAGAYAANKMMKAHDKKVAAQQAAGKGH